MTLTAGTRLGRYEILSPIDKGGMGEVYRASDMKLGREVAVKILPAEFSEHPEKLARFEREARLLAALNHSRIATLLGLEESDGKPILVMELVEGETLANRLGRGPIPPKEALAIAHQVAEALEAAHERGVIHRDLKPANIKVDADGNVKVLDFGLAKALAEDAAESDLSHSPTLSRDATRAGVILGTAAYMSPEQAKGKALDKRTDVFSFGVVLYEMLTGERAFAGEDVPEVLAAVITREPDWKLIPADVDPRIEHLLLRCLRKDRKRRLQAMGDARVEIHDVLSDPEGAARVRPSPMSFPASRARERTAWALAVLVAALGTGLVLGRAISPPPVPLTRLAIGLAETDQIMTSGIAVSPDGRELVYSATRNGVNQLYWRSMERLSAVPLRGTEGATAPFFSPDGAWVGFFADDKLKKVSLAGGLPAIVCDCALGHYHGATWGPEDVIVFTSNQYPGLTRISASGGEPEPLPDGSNEKRWHFWPTFLPGGHAVLFTVASNVFANDGQIAVQSLTTGQRHTLIQGSHPRYAPTGHIVFARADSLWAVPFDADSLELRGPPAPVLDGAQEAGDGLSNFALGGDGSLLYIPGEAAPAPAEPNTPRFAPRLVWVDREGREKPVAADRRMYREFTLSPDGTQLAARTVTGDEQDVWRYDLTLSTSTRLTFDPVQERNPLWSPDGSKVVFGGAEGMFWKAADGTGEVQPIVMTPGHYRPEAFSPDGSVLVYQDLSKDRDLGMVSLEGEPVATLLLDSEFEERNAALSPDGRWMAYESTESGQLEIYVRPFPDMDGGRWQVSSSGGVWPIWAPDGRALFYVGSRDVDLADGMQQDELLFGTVTGRERRPLAGRMIRVPVETERTFAHGPQEPLFDTDRYVTAAVARRVAISPDGQQFLLLKVGGDAAQPRTIVVVQNWVEELKRLVPSDE